MKKLTGSEMGRAWREGTKQIQKIPVVIILENIRSALNTGSVFRTCDAFPVEKIILTGITAQPPHKDILKTALGATESVNWQYYSDIKDCFTELKAKGYKIFAAEQTSQSIAMPDFKPAPSELLAVIFGNEVDGVSNDTLAMCDGAIELPQHGTKHSLNIAVCAGIIIYDLFQKMKP